MKAATSRGQILILVLLIVVVALAVGLSVAARNITNLRSSAQTEQSQRAFTTAEGGVEDVLSRLSTVATEVASAGGTKNYSVDVGGGLSADVTVKSSNVYQSTIDLGNVGQIDLAGTAAGSNIQLEWGKCDDSLEVPPATIAVTQYTKSGSTYSQTRQLFQGDPFAGRSESAPGGSFDPSTGPLSCPSASGFMKSANVTVLSNAVLLRIRPFWVRATVKVSGTTTVQSYDISSTAKTQGGITRKVQVTRTALPQLPAAFDYVLFSGSSINK